MKDLTKGPILKGILGFALPLLLGNLFQMLYTLVDSLIVGKHVGSLAVGAIGATWVISGLIINAGQGVTVGMSLLTSKYFGAKDFDNVRKSFSIGFYFTIGLSLFLSAAGLLLTRPILHAMQTPAAIFDMSQIFMSTLFSSMIFSNLYNYLAASIQALGNSRISLVALILANALNAALSAFFVIVLGWGVLGAGLATIGSQGFSVLFLLIYVKHRQPYFGFHWVKFTRQELMEHLRMGLPVGFQSSVIGLGSIIQQVAINKMGTLAVIGFSIGQKYDGFAGSVTGSLGIAMATFAAQNLGANAVSRIARGIKQVLVIAVSYSVVFAVFLLIFNRSFTGLFMNAQSDPAIFNMSFLYYLANGSVYWLLGVLFVTRYTLQGLGQMRAPTLAGTMELVFRSICAITGVLLNNIFIVFASEGIAWIGSTAVLIPAVQKAFKAIKKTA
ncbi:MAG: MATE family efflux transporter [Streptococcaceae bacterium]|jgi:putative MATE family efflux protein|nr:MATE family efflux transporter [Streptococcaceae bacterium]